MTGEKLWEKENGKIEGKGKRGIICEEEDGRDA